jgi:UDP-N-acetylmuramyl pentapeptide phosphotransferase/UDP-N-acetylglucosamine-1-phosphate transferase
VIWLAVPGAAVLAAAIWWAMRPALAAPVFERQNHRGAVVPTAGGVPLVLAAVVVLAFVWWRDDALAAAATTALVATGFGFLGLLDDLGGAGESGGFRGHVAALGRGRLTTGMVKLVGGAAVALVAVGTVEPHASVARVLADAALVALAANLGNLLDRAPGRVTKVTIVALLVLGFTTGWPATLVGAAVVAGAAAGLLLPDLREQLMLGDVGANVLGAALGLGVVLACSPGVRTVVLVVVLALNAISELVSFSRVIDRVPPLRAVDRVGRLP